MINLIQGDCLEKMKDLQNGSIDMILTDPPYGTTACKWDSIIDLNLMWKELKRIIKPNAAIALFGSEPFSSKLRMSNLKMFKYDWIWEKNQATGGMNANKIPLFNYEVISIFYKKLPRYTPQFTIGTPYKLKRQKPSINSVYGKTGTKNNYISINDGKRYPKRIIQFNVQRGVHPTQKPTALMEYLIKTYTNENETVLDFTMGSGSTGIACKTLNRNFIGIELDEKYFNIAKERIEGITV
jgi:DNA modification methylase